MLTKRKLGYLTYRQYDRDIEEVGFQEATVRLEKRMCSLYRSSNA